MNKKVLIVSNNTSALYGFRYELISKLISMGCSVETLAPLDNKYAIDKLIKCGCVLNDIKINRRGTNPLEELKLYKEYKKQIKAIKPDIVITYTIKPNIYMGMVCCANHIDYYPNITGLGTAFQGSAKSVKVFTYLYKKALKGAKRVFFENSGNAEIFINKSIVNKDKVVVLNGAGVNLDRFYYLDYPDKDDVVNFIYIGRIMKEKGFGELLGAFRRLVDEGRSVKLSVLGYFEEDWKALIDECEDQGWLKYYGYQTDIKPYMKNAHCEILPSWHEGMANVNLEAASMGRPVITSDIHGCKEAVIDGLTGYTFKVKDEDSLYCAINDFLDLSLDDKRDMGIRAREHMKNTFDKNKVVTDTVDALQI